MLKFMTLEKSYKQKGHKYIFLGQYMSCQYSENSVYLENSKNKSNLVTLSLKERLPGLRQDGSADQQW
jgi:hypothetical protein